MSHATVHPASWRWIRNLAVATFVSLVAVAALLSTGSIGPSAQSAPEAATPNVSPSLAALAERRPGKTVEVIVQMEKGASPASVRGLIGAHGGDVTREVRLINGLAATMPAAEAVELSYADGVRAVSMNARIAETGGLIDTSLLSSAYALAIRSDAAWGKNYGGKGVGVAVIDTGIAGDVSDFRVSATDSSSRVVASAVVNPAATNANDGYGHGTHIAGLAAGRSANGKYVGVAPEANLIAIKASDDHGAATVLDVIDGVQFAVDHKSDYNIKVLNLSLRSTNAESYKTDPLDAAVESAWFSGIVVVAAAGNMGGASDAVSYAPANDPFVITVGGTDDHGTKSTSDDDLAYWSSRGTTQDGFKKPDVLAPGAHLVSTLSPGSDYESLCPACVTEGSYFKVSGTSMAAGVASGAVADIVQAKPTWTPDQIKSTLVKRSNDVKGLLTSVGSLLDKDVLMGKQIALDKVIGAGSPEPAANQNITPNPLVDRATGTIDYSRASWSRASWSDAADPLRASWSRASWSRASWSRASWSATPESCSDFERASWSRASWSAEEIAAAKEACTSMDPTRASWSVAETARASWSTFFSTEY
jgi:serine protease AprX